MTDIAKADLAQAKAGSWFTILGCGGPLEDWVTGVNEALTEEKIGTPTTWFQTTGADINHFAGAGIPERDKFPGDLTVLMFPLDGLNVGKLAAFKMRVGARWFDDIIDNMRG